MTVTFPTFKSSDSRFPPCYKMTTIFGSSIEPLVFTFNNLTRVLSTYTSNHNFVGTITMLYVSYLDIPFNITDSRAVIITILDKCVRNKISSGAIKSIDYYVGDPEITKTYLPWTYNMTECGPIDSF